MDNSKFLQRLKKLTPREFRQFASLVRSPFFTTHADTIRLFDLIEPFYPEFGIEDESIVVAFNPDAPLSMPRLRVLRTYLLDLLEEFLVQLQFKESNALRADFLSRQYMQRGFFQDAQQLLQTQNQVLNERYFLESSDLIQHLQIQISLVNLNVQKENRAEDLGLVPLLDSLEIFYLGTRLQYFCSFVSLGFHITLEIPFQTITNTLKQVESSPYLDQPIIFYYYHLLHLLTQSPHEIHYPILLEYISQSREIPGEELVNIFGFLQNHLNQRYQKGQSAALGELLALYKIMIARNMIFGRGAISIHLFRNIVVVGARLGEYAFIESFIEDGARQLDEAHSESLLHYCMAYLKFTQQEYTAALQHMQHINFIDPFYRTGHQILLLRIYYETGEVEPFISLCQTFRRYLNRNRILSAQHKDASLAFITIARLLMAAKESTGTAREESISRIWGDIQEAKYLTDRTWIIEKWEELNAS